jgi:hypothetical protein
VTIVGGLLMAAILRAAGIVFCTVIDICIPLSGYMHALYTPPTKGNGYSEH